MEIGKAVQGVPDAQLPKLQAHHPEFLKVSVETAEGTKVKKYFSGIINP